MDLCRDAATSFVLVMSVLFDSLKYNLC